MLEPKEADIPILFLFLVVFPLVAYVLLGTWSESTKKRDWISLLAQLAAEEALRVEAMATDCAPPVIPTPNNGIHVCARCFSQATTRCSRCKAVRYCSGKCQIIHWRQFHKLECQLLEANCSSISPNTVNEDSFSSSVSVNENLNSYSGYYKKQAMIADTASSDISCPSISMTTSFPGNCSAIEKSQEAIPRRNIDKHISCHSSRVMLRRQDVIVCDSLEETSGSKLSNGSNYNDISGNGQDAVSTMHETYKYSRQCAKSFELRSRITISSSNRGKSGTHVNEPESDLISSGDNLPSVQNTINDEVAAVKGSLKNKSSLHSSEVKAAKSKSKMTLNGEHSYSRIEGKPNIADDSQIPKLRDTAHQLGINGVAGINIMKMMGLRKSTKLARQDMTEFKGMHGKKRTLFPYEEFMEIFNCKVVNLLPRGLINCGNSCYANAVLQCLTYTKPLAIFLLQRLHSRNCWGKDWCVMCELEQHVMMLRECGSPLSPSRILLHMRNTNCQIGHGSQEDAHEFLRLLVASMQSICLEGLGGEDMVDPRLQEATFIQHTFGGCLRSKVKCLRCHHESERYENIMDLSLEIFGWVESLEDALTQFTTPEELDGENMYRCGSCGTYARARKQLSIHEAPNILTIVLKRFQEGKYGKINKWITFPDMLDMIPFMTQTVDIPPLYMLYAVVVHLDTLNASFSGHYVSYVKDSQGNWFRMDDTEVQPVPMSQVMSEGAYILFYKRSFPRPMKVFDEIGTKKVPVSAIHCTSRTRKPSKQEQSKYSSYFGVPKPSVDIKPQISSSTNSKANGILRSANGNIAQVEFSDATSSNWSLFTSSDDASFTTESTRDSFSTVDYTDASNADTFTSIFDNLYAPKSSSVNTPCCRKFSNSIAQSRFILEERGYVSYMLNQPPNRLLKGDNFEQVSDSSNGNYYSMSVKFGSNERCNLDRTCCHCKL